MLFYSEALLIHIAVKESFSRIELGIGTLRQAGALTALCSCGLGQREDPIHKGDAGGAAPGRRHQAPPREGRGHHPGSWLHHLQGTIRTYKN